MSDTFRKESARDWNRGTTQPTMQDIQVGCLQRIADATELMAKRHQELVDAKRSAESSRDYWRDMASQLEFSIRSLRGQITKLKKQIAAAKGATA
jgi:hypothetical protein